MKKKFKIEKSKGQGERKELSILQTQANMRDTMSEHNAGKNETDAVEID